MPLRIATGLPDLADQLIDGLDGQVLVQRFIEEGHGSGVAGPEAFEGEAKTFKVNWMSFGFKYGLPADADMVADARFIPNPHWKETLRDKTGNDKAVSEYVLSQPGVDQFLDTYLATLKTVLAGYRRENKRFATVAIGCTGGKHRSVALTNKMAKLLSEDSEIQVAASHRDLGRE